MRIIPSREQVGDTEAWAPGSILPRFQLSDLHFWQTLPAVSDRASLWAVLWKIPVRVLFTEIAEG